MSSTNVFSKPVKTIMENDVLSDIVHEDEELLLAKNFIKRLSEIENSPNEFFVTVIDNANVVKGIVTRADLETAANKIAKNKRVTFREVASTPVIMKEGDSIRCALDTFEQKNTRIILIVNEQNVYVGKLRISTIRKKIMDLFDAN